MAYLKKCPFCNKVSMRAEFSIHRTSRLPSGELIRVMCVCGAMSPASETIESAFTAWDYRPELGVALPSASTNAESDAITLLKRFDKLNRYETGGVASLDLILNDNRSFLKKIAKQHTFH